MSIKYLETFVPRPYHSANRIRRIKPTTLAARREATALRLLIRNRRTKKAERLAAIEKLNLLAPPIPKPEVSPS
jgi:hypothetical protein